MSELPAIGVGLDISPIDRECPQCGDKFNPRWYEPAGKYTRVCGKCAFQNLESFLSEPDDTATEQESPQGIPPQ